MVPIDRSTDWPIDLDWPTEGTNEWTSECEQHVDDDNEIDAHLLVWTLNQTPELQLSDRHLHRHLSLIPPTPKRLFHQSRHQFRFDFDDARRQTLGWPTERNENGGKLMDLSTTISTVTDAYSNGVRTIDEIGVQSWHLALTVMPLPQKLQEDVEDAEEQEMNRWESWRLEFNCSALWLQSHNQRNNAYSTWQLLIGKPLLSFIL